MKRSSKDKESLTKIYASSNRLGNEGFPYSVLPSLPNLYYLALKSNGITSLPVTIPSNNLTYLYYNENFIDILEEGTFQKCKELKYLCLKYNSITSISPGENLLLIYRMIIMEYRGMCVLCTVKLNSVAY